MAFFPNPGFEEHSLWPMWHKTNLAEAVTFGREASPLSRIGSTVVWVRTTAAGGSISHDLYLPDGWQGRSLICFTWVRARPGQPEVNGSLALWNLTVNEASSVRFTAGQEWLPVTNVADMSSWSGQYRICRVEFYLDSVGQDLLIDAINIV